MLKNSWSLFRNQGVDSRHPTNREIDEAYPGTQGLDLFIGLDWGYQIGCVPLNI